MTLAEERTDGPSPRPLLGASGLSKRFGGTRALIDVSLQVAPGEIHALLGENGAGKSTLIKILAGVYRSDSGSVFSSRGVGRPGQPCPGVAFVHQDLGLVGTVSVAENIALYAGFPRRTGLIDWRGARALARTALARLGLEIDPDTLVGQLGAAEKSLVAIARALSLDADVVVLDEPTATLPQQDVVRLHEGLRLLRAKGLGILYVTHRLDEVFAIADRVSVLRDGRLEHSGAVSETDAASLVAHILGRPLANIFPPKKRTVGSPVLQVRQLRSKLVEPTNFSVAEGEILGLVGLRNSGQDILGRLVAGALPARGGTVEMSGRAVRNGSVRAAIGAGIAFISSKRVEESIGPGLTLRENLAIVPKNLGIRMINTAAESRVVRGVLGRFGVRPPEPDRPILTLSGGNQQKVVLARALASRPKLIVLEEPTTGVDVGARSEIYLQLATATAEGLAVIVVSSDFEEVCGLCQRALVFGRGKFLAELSGSELSVSRVAEISGRKAS